MQEKIKRILPYALFVLLVCIFLWRPIFTGSALLPADYLTKMQPWASYESVPTQNQQWNALSWDSIAQFYPWRVFYIESIKKGSLPLWNPHQFCGTPFQANGQSAVLYPFNLVFTMFDPITAFTVFAALHLLLCLIFTYLFIRSLAMSRLAGIIGSVCFTFSAFIVLWLELPTFISAAVYLPLTLLLVSKSIERRSYLFAAFAGLSLSLAFLAGHLQIAFYVALASAMWWLWKLYEDGFKNCIVTKLSLFALFCLTAALFASPQMLPSKELASNSHRISATSDAGYERFVDNGVKPFRFITAFAPDYYGNPANNDYFISSPADYMEFGLYAGILPFILAVIAVVGLREKRSRIFFLILLVLSFLTASGTAINYIFYYFIPGFAALGGPQRILILYMFSLAVLSAYGIDMFIENKSVSPILAGSPEKNWMIRKNVRFYLITICSAHLIFAILFAVSRFISINYLHSITLLALPESTNISPQFIAIAILSFVLLTAYTIGLLGKETFKFVVVLLVVVDLFAFGISFNKMSDRSKVYPQTPLITKLKEIAQDGRIAPVNSRWSLSKVPDALLPPNAAMVYGIYDFQGYDSLYTKEYKDFSSSIQDQDSSPQENGNMVFYKKYSPEIWSLCKYVLTTDINIPDADIVDTIDGVNIYKSKNSLTSTNIKYIGVNKFIASSVDSKDTVTSVINYPGWKAELDGASATIVNNAPFIKVKNTDGKQVTFNFEPFSFRLGMFMLMLGVCSISTLITVSALRRKII